jgi:hypothetical protein
MCFAYEIIVLLTACVQMKTYDLSGACTAATTNTTVAAECPSESHSLSILLLAAHTCGGRVTPACHPPGIENAGSSPQSRARILQTASDMLQIEMFRDILAHSSPTSRLRL